MRRVLLALSLFFVSAFRGFEPLVLSWDYPTASLPIVEHFVLCVDRPEGAGIEECIPLGLPISTDNGIIQTFTVTTSENVAGRARRLEVAAVSGQAYALSNMIWTKDPPPGQIHR